MNLSISLRSEVLKTKRTAAFYFTLISAAVVPIIFLLNALLDDDMDSTRKDPLNNLFKLLGEMNGMAFFPWFIILICTLLPQVEYKNNTWKQLFASPQSKVNVFLAKLLNIHLLILLFMVATHLFMFLAIVIANVFIPSFDFFSKPLNGYTVLSRAANAYVTSMALMAIHFWMGLRFKNFIVPIAAGLALWLTGTVLIMEYKSILALYLPYSFQAYYLFPQFEPQLNQVQWTSVGYAAFFLVAGFLDLRRRRMSS